MISFDVMPILRLGIAHALQQALDRDRERQAAIRMRFGIEEDFRMHAAIGMQPREIGQRQRRWKSSSVCSTFAP